MTANADPSRPNVLVCLDCGAVFPHHLACSQHPMEPGLSPYDEAVQEEMEKRDQLRRYKAFAFWLTVAAIATCVITFTLAVFVVPSALEDSNTFRLLGVGVMIPLFFVGWRLAEFQGRPLFAQWLPSYEGVLSAEEIAAARGPHSPSKTLEERILSLWSW